MKRKSKITTESIINDFKDVHGLRYNYDKVNYISMHNKVIITCLIHGDFEILPNHHLKRKVNCAKCSFEENRLNKRDTTESFLLKAINIHKNRYDYSIVKYGETAHDKIDIICREHGVFEMSPNSHLSGKSNCPKCSQKTSKRKLIKNNNLGWNKTEWIKRCNGKSSNLYIIECWNEEERFIKIGITSKSIKERFTKNKIPYNYKILKIFSSTNAGLIYDMEHVLLRNSKKFKYLPKKYFPGITECRTTKFNYGECH